MVQASLLRSLILCSVFCMALCSTSVPSPSPDAASAKDSVANSTAIPTLGTPAGLNSTESDPAASGDMTTHQPTPDVKAPATPGSSSVPGVLSADGKCTCPGVPPVSAGPSAVEVNSTEQTGSTPPPVAADNTPGSSTNDTSSTSFIKAPTNLCLLAVSAVVGVNALIA